MSQRSFFVLEPVVLPKLYHNHGVTAWMKSECKHPSHLLELSVSTVNPDSLTHRPVVPQILHVRFKQHYLLSSVSITEVSIVKLKLTLEGNIDITKDKIKLYSCFGTICSQNKNNFADIIAVSM